METNIYNNPLLSRYASKEMSGIFSEDNRIVLFRKLWLALAKSEKQLGLNITEDQISELEDNLTNINYDVAEKREKEVRHDVMAHVYAYGVLCPKAAPIIHLGATSCYVTDNADIVIYKQALELVRLKAVAVIDKLANFAKQYKKMPTLGFTHLQPAQLVTVGKRATLWLQDFLIDVENLDFTIDNLKMRGAKGTTGTQASFMQLFDNDGKKVKQLEKLIVENFGFKEALSVSGQTYTRKIDYNILSNLSMLAQSAYKFSNDIRILQNMKEIEEPFEKNQIGSSAMAYKRNPMRSERIGSLARFVLSMPINTAITASTQWMERTLDDSANRRIVMAQSFLAIDAILELMLNVVSGLVVYEKVIQKHIKAELPFMATEVILMECVKAGGNRQELHEKIRVLSMEAGKQVKVYGKSNDLIERIKKDDAFKPIHNMIDKIMNPKNFIGRCPEQVDEFLKEKVNKLLKKYQGKLNFDGIVKV